MRIRTPIERDFVRESCRARVLTLAPRYFPAGMPYDIEDCVLYVKRRLQLMCFTPPELGGILIQSGMLDDIVREGLYNHWKRKEPYETSS